MKGAIIKFKKMEEFEIVTDKGEEGEKGLRSIWVRNSGIFVELILWDNSFAVFWRKQWDIRQKCSMTPSKSGREAGEQAITVVLAIPVVGRGLGSQFLPSHFQIIGIILIEKGNEHLFKFYLRYY